ncbi:hypothetical protein ACVWY5_005233 [Bradyrhizobium sp. USDA 3256]
MSRECKAMSTDSATHSASSRRRPGPITTNGNCLARCRNHESHSQHPLRSMGPGLRRDDSGGRTPPRHKHGRLWKTGSPACACAGDDTALFDSLNREPSPPSSWRRPGPITPNLNHCATLGPQSLLQSHAVVMGPGRRQDDDESRPKDPPRHTVPVFAATTAGKKRAAFAPGEPAIAKPRIDLIAVAGHSVRAVSLNGRKSRKGYRRIEFCSAAIAQLAPAKGAMAMLVACL